MQGRCDHHNSHPFSMRQYRDLVQQVIARFTERNHSAQSRQASRQQWAYVSFKREESSIMAGTLPEIDDSANRNPEAMGTNRNRVASGSMNRTCPACTQATGLGN